MLTPARTATIAIEITEDTTSQELLYAVSTQGLAGGETMLIETLDALVKGLKAGV